MELDGSASKWEKERRCIVQETTEQVAKYDATVQDLQSELTEVKDKVGRRSLSSWPINCFLM